MIPLDTTLVTTLTPYDLLIFILLLVGAIIILRLALDWYIGKIAPTKPNQALILKALIRPLIITLILLGLSLFIYFVHPPDSTFIYSLLGTIALITWTASSLIIVKRLIKVAAQNLSVRYHRPVSDAAPMLTSFAVTTILFLSLYALFLIWGINVTPLVAAISVIGAALSFAARDAVGNTISGISIFITQPFKVGDFIVVDDKQQGTIQEIGVQQTKLLSPQKTILIIPNSTIITKPVENHTAINPYVKFSLPLSLPLTTDIEPIKKTLIASAAENKWLLPTPQPRVRIINLTKDNLKIELTAALKDPNKKALVTHQLLQALANLP